VQTIWGSKVESAPIHWHPLVIDDVFDDGWYDDFEPSIGIRLVLLPAMERDLQDR
jgi:hypothetical protein